MASETKAVRPDAEPVPGATTAQRYPNFRWVRYPQIKLFIYFFGRPKATDEFFVKNRYWSSVGLSAADLYAHLTRCFPWFEETFHHETNGMWLTPERCRDRFFNFFWDRSGGWGERCISAEHPTRSPRLSPYLEMGEAMWEWLAADPSRTVDKATARELFDGPPRSRKETLARLAGKVAVPNKRREVSAGQRRHPGRRGAA